MYQRVEFACAALLLAAIVLLVGVAAITRAYGAPIIWSVEIAQLMFVWLVMLAADLALQQDRHFGLSMVLDRLSPAAARILAIANLLVMIGLLGFLLFHSLRNTALMHRSLVGATQMPASYIHAAMPFGLVLMLRTLLVQLYAAIRGRSTT
ncbi:TRAP-type C4-dicarboxylate transport system permease small subunit [Tepidamorphus gemmatus]|jgi:TRAP-type C4-dicarboxylate transport system permease small subunit|uniref:TRAP transporter small permease protein n=1 Tax=Tepidamorphus gemmatus TaxID=747076 RepID=A0A4R3MGS6_9HYPH|nr:TRAP transporter small permease subunit [Tepidamorphus gemmatus]TCT13175.1 TRAP-type C4-dicarboxylate transport system permease small subunit [Tepidamorphus gemmatus]